MPKIVTNTEIINRFKKIHGKTYDYSKTYYINSKTKVKIICKKHGVFEQYPSHHLKGCGCPKCSTSYKEPLTNIEFITKAKIIHKGKKYRYDKCNYKNAHNKVIITCPIHGDFEQLALNHLKGCGCNKCGYIKSSETKTKDLKYYLEKFKKIHNNKYDYSFVKMKKIITIICPIHGKFKQSFLNHSNGNGCKKCACTKSKIELELQNHIIDLDFTIITNDRDVIKPYELDIYIPELNKAIEFNGEYWHYSKKYFTPGKHAKKSMLCKEKGIKLLHIREDLWLKDKEKMKKVIYKFLKSQKYLNTQV